MKTFNSTLALIGLLLLAGPVAAGIDGLSLGTVAPPASVGTFAVTPFTADPSPTWTPLVLSVALPAGATPSGSLLFDTALTHWTVDPSMWATWSNGYKGDVYWYDTFSVPQDGIGFAVAQSDVGTFTLNLTLPTGTKAFYLYVEPGPFDNLNFDVTGTGTGGQKAFTAQSIDGNGGAAGFGFFATDPASTVNSVSITAYDVPLLDGFAVGEFGIDGTGEARVPDTGATVLLLGLPVIALAILRKQFTR